MRSVLLRRFCVAIVTVVGALHCAVTDIAGANVTLAWDPNSETNLAGYKVYYGTSSGTYPFVADVGNATTQVITDLQPGDTYYFAATAYNLAGLESDFSGEIMHTVPMPSIVSFGDGSFQIHFRGVPGRTYRIQYSESLNPAIWRSLGSRTADDSGSFEIVDRPSADSPTRFYRSVYP